MKNFGPRSLLKYDYEKLSSTPRQPPPGYVFVPKGEVYITRNCRKLTSEQGKTVWVVYNHVTGKSIGLHIPRAVYQEVKANAAATATERQTAVLRKDERELADAAAVIARLFPRMPPSSVDVVLNHAFQKGSGRVGRTSTLTEDQKVRSAVLAHIRHVHTPYDRLLKDVSREEAREQIWSLVSDTAASWGPPSASSTRRSELRELHSESSPSLDRESQSSDDVVIVETENDWRRASLKPQPRVANPRIQLTGRIIKTRSGGREDKTRLPPSAAVDPKSLNKAIKFVKQYETVPLKQLTETEKHRLRESRRQMQKARIPIKPND